MARVDYSAKYREILDHYRLRGKSVSQDELFSDPRLGDASDVTKRKHLKSFLDSFPEYIGLVHGVLPSTDKIIDLAELELMSPVSQANVVAANRACKAIVDKVYGPALEEFVRIELSAYVSGGIISLPMHELLSFLSTEYAVFQKGAGNGLVSIAGTINEKLLARCLIEQGMTNGTEYSVTGTESEGDIIVHSQAALKTNLGVEIKSYHARERLLRGLRDVDRPKVGAGFFIDASEFNPTRTKLLMETQAAAIYMPEETRSKLDTASLNMTTIDRAAYGSLFYRPIERFAEDMKYFSKNGYLPKFI